MKKTIFYFKNENGEIVKARTTNNLYKYVITMEPVIGGGEEWRGLDETASTCSATYEGIMKAYNDYINRGFTKWYILRVKELFTKEEK